MKNKLIKQIAIIHICLSFIFAFVKTDGKRIIDLDGNEVIFRGIGIGGWLMPEGYMLKIPGFGSPTSIEQKIVNLIGREGADEFYSIYLENYFNEKDLIQIKDWGFNSIRLPFHYKLLAEIGSPVTFKEDGFAIIDSVATWCERHKIYLILDMHAAPGGQNHGNISDSDGEAKLWTVPDNQEYTIAIWREIAKRYVKSKWIAGYDLLNEPVMPEGFDNRDLRNLYLRITKAIREVDKNHIIIIEGNWYATEFSYLTPPIDNNLVYGFHKYWSPNTIGSIQQYLTIRNNFNVPIWLGEFGENSNHWFQEMIELSESKSIGWNWWTHKKVDSITSPLSVPMTEKYSQLIKYWNNEIEKPSETFARTALLEMARKLNIDSCRVHPDVINAITNQQHPSPQKPFKQHTIPTIVESEDYNMGNNNVAYYDTNIEKLHWENFDAWNSGWVYRNDGVDVGQSESEKGTYYIGWTEPGEWVKYTINVQNSGLYEISARVASVSSTSTVILSIDGTNISKEVIIPSTGSWDTWEIINISEFDLQAGEVTITMKFINGNVNVDYIDIQLLESENYHAKINNLFIGKPFPNPFSSRTSLPIVCNEASEIDVIIFDVIGNSICNIYNGAITAGSRTINWDGKNSHGNKVSSGEYFFLIKNKGSILSEKIVYLK